MTTKEQWLLVGFVVAVLTGCITVLVHEKWTAVSEESSSTVTIVRKMHPVETAKPSVPMEQSASQPSIPVYENMTETSVVESVSRPKMVGVAIMGAVQDPDLYMLEEGARVADLIAAAGGLADNADASDILMTAPLVDETTITIPELPVVRMDETRIVARRNSGNAVLNPPWYRRSAAYLYSRQMASETAVSDGSAVAQNADDSSVSGLLNINQATSEQLQKLPGIGPVFAERIIQERTKQPFMTIEDIKRVSGIAEKRLEAIRPFITAP